MDDDILATLARRAIPTFSMQAGELLALCARGDTCASATHRRAG
jgi:hypothetical protein